MRFAERSRALFVLVLSAVLFAAAGCAGGNEARKQEQAFRRSFQKVYERYTGYETRKALALARDEDGQWAYGYARGQESEMQAVNTAKQQCERQRARYGVRVSCRTYAVGDEIVGDPALLEELPSEE